MAFISKNPPLQATTETTGYHAVCRDSNCYTPSPPAPPPAPPPCVATAQRDFFTVCDRHPSEDECRAFSESLDNSPSFSLLTPNAAYPPGCFIQEGVHSDDNMVRYNNPATLTYAAGPLGEYEHFLPICCEQQDPSPQLTIGTGLFLGDRADGGVRGRTARTTTATTWACSRRARRSARPS